MSASLNDVGWAAVSSPEELVDWASALVGWRVTSVVPVRGGGNNRVFRLVGRRERAALKFYPPQQTDRRDRLGREYAALSFLAELGFEEVARPIAADPARCCAAYEWIDGTPPDRVGDAEIDEMAAFFIRLQRVRGCERASSFGPASANVFSPAMVTEQVDERLDRLIAAIKPGSKVAAFVDEALSPAIASANARLRANCEVAGIGFSDRLPSEACAFSPSDFGLHNALRRPNGRLVFLDFEYFGWDDPAKAVGDVMLHPGMSLTDELAHRYRAAIEQALRTSDPRLSQRLNLFFPSMVLLWCLILLNEFLPERWERRVFAGVSEERDAVQAKQLRKARELLSRAVARASSRGSPIPPFS
jgi:hypothetical protein